MPNNFRIIVMIQEIFKIYARIRNLLEGKKSKLSNRQNTSEILKLMKIFAMTRVG